MDENLRQPLKRRTIRDRLNQFKPSALQAVSSAVLVSAITVGVWFYQHDVPFAGEPVIAIKIHPLEKISTAKTPKKKPSGSEPDIDIAKTRDSAEPNPDDLAADRAALNQQVAIIVRPGRITSKPLRKAPIRSVSEKGPFGSLPKIARNGRKPSSVYASKLGANILNSGRPKIALVIGGMGINVKLTNQAIRELPGHVTFAFAPYGRNLQAMINRARQAGHEVILHLPMEPFGYPGINPGPKTLLANAEPQDNLANLKWFMSRFSGYTGVTNYMGAKFTNDGGALLPVFSQLNARGLNYFDDGSNGKTLTESIAQAANLPARTADIAINDDQTFTAIRQTLSRLESIARKRGLAIGTGTGLSSTIDAVESWSRELEDRGFLLVPLSLAYKNLRS